VQLFFRVSQAATALGVCIKTLHRWDKLGSLECFRTSGGHRRIPVSEIRRLSNQKTQNIDKKHTAIYSRVSSHEQKKKGDL